jgi:hypothetical protein
MGHWAPEILLVILEVGPRRDLWLDRPKRRWQDNRIRLYCRPPLAQKRHEFSFTTATSQTHPRSSEFVLEYTGRFSVSVSVSVSVSGCSGGCQWRTTPWSEKVAGPGCPASYSVSQPAPAMRSRGENWLTRLRAMWPRADVQSIGWQSIHRCHAAGRARPGNRRGTEALLGRAGLRAGRVRSFEAAGRGSPRDALLGMCRSLARAPPPTVRARAFAMYSACRSLARSLLEPSPKRS